MGPRGVDFTPEVYVGRIPVYGGDYASLDAILRKIIAYETDSAAAWRGRLLSLRQWPDELRHRPLPGPGGVVQRPGGDADDARHRCQRRHGDRRDPPGPDRGGQHAAFSGRPGKVGATPWQMIVDAGGVATGKREKYQYSVILDSGLGMEVGFDRDVYGAATS